MNETVEKYDLAEVLRVYEGSDGNATTTLYKSLESFGPAGFVALNLFRANKCSQRAKVYRGRRFKDSAYDRKQWSMNNLCGALGEHATSLGIVWGWGQDTEQVYHNWVLYVEIPTGQVSFHTDHRGSGPDYPKPWDGIRNVSPQRVCMWIAQLYAAEAPRP